MKIIKRGILPSEKKAEWTCNHCKSIIESTQAEGRIISDRDGNLVESVCPVCNYTSYISVTKFK